MFAALRGMRPDLLIAAADEQSVEDFSSRMSGRLPDVPVVSFPTRVDTALFYPEDKFHARRTLGWTSEGTILVALGRLCWVKGWELLLQALAELRSRGSSAMLAFVGDGEDRRNVYEMAASLGVADHIQITGFVPHDTVRTCINAADLCVVGSYQEGWSVAMLEELACGKPIVSTPVSGASRLVQPGKNGFIVQERHPVAYADAIEAALTLTAADAVSLEIAQHFSAGTLAHDLATLWRPLASHAARRSAVLAGKP
jgi:glycosyltransferase involved in cell wall biosynthesis